MTRPELQPEPEPPSASFSVTGSELPEEQEMRLHILYEADAECVPVELTEKVVERCCNATLKQQAVLNLAGVSDCELSIQLLDTEAMRLLNLQYRKKDGSTNVLSFASGMPLMGAQSEAADGGGSGGLLILGDLVFCPQIIVREATEQAKLPVHHWMHMLVHGTLHLCGYDHEDEQEARVMEALEIQILSGLGLPDPYAAADAVNRQ